MGWHIVKAGFGLTLCGALTYAAMTSPETLNIKRYWSGEDTAQPASAKWKLTPNTLKQTEQVLEDLRWTPPHATDTAHEETEAPKGIAVGQTKDQILALKGEPTSHQYGENSWIYDDMTVFFDGYQVTGWMNSDAMLHNHSRAEETTVAQAEDTASPVGKFMMHLGYGSVDRPYASSSRSSSGSRYSKSRRYANSAPRSAFFQQNRRTYSNYFAKPTWLQQWSSYRSFSMNSSPKQYGNAGSRYSRNSYSRSNSGRSSR